MIEKGDKLAIYDETSYEWCVAEQACYTQSITVLTVYATLGMEALEYALNSAKVTYIVANSTLFPQLVSIKDHIHLNTIILTGPEDDKKAGDVLRGMGIKIIPFDDVLAGVRDTLGLGL